MWADLRRDTGSVLLLMPAGVLVVLILGAISVDAAVAFLGERELADLTAAAANDAATGALREDAFYECGELRLEPTRAADIATTVAGARSSDAVTLTDVRVSVRNDASPPSVTVAATGHVRLIFTPAVPGAPHSRTVAARSTAVPRHAGGEAALPARCRGA